MKRYQVKHRTTYQYKEEVSLGHNEARLIPRTLEHQFVKKTSVKITPQPEIYEERKDYYGNTVSYFSIEDSHKKLDVVAQSEIELNPRREVDLSKSLPWEDSKQSLYQDKHPNYLKARQFVFDSSKAYTHPAIQTFAKASFPSGRPLLEATMDLVYRIYDEFDFDPKATTISTPVETVLERKKGVCQDFAHLAISCLRSLGFAASYISGYLETLPPPGKPKLQGADASHAWFAIFCPYHGWVEFDPTNNQLPNFQYITLGWGRDYLDISPLKGIIFGGGKTTLSVAVDVIPQS